jgi:hypothetical protein
LNGSAASAKSWRLYSSAQAGPAKVSERGESPNGWTGGAGHFNMMEAPDQVNAMIEGFLRHYV